jgi:hypothetical protein
MMVTPPTTAAPTNGLGTQNPTSLGSAGAAAPVKAAVPPASMMVAPATPPPMPVVPPAMMGMVNGAAGAPSMPTGTAGTGAVDHSAPLAVPEAGKGVQIKTTSFVLMPGQEVYRCYHAVIPVMGDVEVARWESQMTEGSHHFILYKNDGDTSPDGTMDSAGCTLGFDQRWIFSSAQPYNELKMPQGVAMALASRQQVVFDLHYINTTQKPLTVQVALNVHLAQGTFEKAASLVSFNVGIFLPPKGQQTVTGTCTPGNGAKFFLMTTHTHRRGTLATITRMDGTELVRTTNWDDPTIKHFDPGFVTFQPGESFNYTCAFQNDLDTTVTIGTSADTNEMCMAITYFYPASAAGSCN